MHVVVAEDQSSDFAFIQRKLNSLGIDNITHFRTGEKLVKELKQGLKADLYFLDVRMRSIGLNGRDLIHELRANPKNKNATIALMSDNLSLLENTDADFAFEKGRYFDLIENVGKIALDLYQNFDS